MFIPTFCSTSARWLLAPGTAAAWKMALTTAALFLGFLPTAHAQIYVDADNTSGTQDGTSWATAYSSFRTALLNAGAGDAIWVADGTYPTGATRDNSFTFTGAKDGLQIYGGFQGLSRPGGGETTLDQRNPDAYEAVLTGDVDGDGTLGGNAYHVFVLDGTNDPITPATVIDGVVITGGNASGNSFPINAGGGLLCRGEGGLCNPTIVGVTFRGNRAGFGGAMFNEGEHGGQSRPMIVNSVFVGNEATSNGGAMLNSGKGTNGQGSPVIINTTFTGNTAGGNGGAMINNGLNGGRAEPQLTNVILWNNDATDGAELYNLDATPTLTHTLIEGGIDGPGVSEDPVNDGGGNLDADPLFVDADGLDDTFGTADDDVRALRTSPVLDAGTNVPFETVAQTIETDIAGNDRIQDEDGDGTATVDVGAFEGGAPLVWYVDADATGDADGSSWTDAFRDLQNAFAAAQAGDEIWVAEGTYYPDEGQNVDEDDRTESFFIPGEKDGLQIYGGFAGDETQRTQRDPSQHRSILSGDISANDRSLHVVKLVAGATEPITRATVIDGVTITKGNASGGTTIFSTAGGGVYCNGSGDNVTCSPTLSNIIFRSNAALYGGAIYNGGYDEGTSSPLIVNAVFIDNQAARGGAIFNDGSKDAFTGGELGSAGGTSSPTLVNVTLVNNTAGFYAGAMYSYGGDNGTSQPTLANAVLWNNTADLSGDQLFNSNATPTLTHTLIEGGLSGDGITNDNGGSLQDGGGNFDADPLFVDVNGADDTFGTQDDDVRLFVGSPALNAGTNDAVPADTPDLDDDGDTTEPLPVDRAGEARIQVGTVDLGAYEGGILRVREGTSGLPPVRGPADWGDVDNDGDLDLALAGGLLEDPVTAIYRNEGDTDGDGRPDFTELQADFLEIRWDGDVAWGDYDNDGDLDLLVIGPTATTTGVATARIYRNDGANGDGTVDFTTLFASDINLPGFRSESTAAWGDYDSDGDLDLVIGGLNPSSQRLMAIYRNDGDTDNDSIVNFTDIQAGLPDLSNPALAWGDFDEDGDLDLILQGLPDTGSPVTAIYRNDGDSDGDGLADFTDIGAGLLGVEDGSVDWGDYDGDGDLDLVITGSVSDVYATRIYRNDGDTNSDGTVTFTSLNGSITGLPDVDNSVGQWGDADLDGDLDLLLVGIESITSDAFEVFTRLYRNDGGDRFTQFPGILAGVIAGDGTWGDYDGDGDLDIVVTGFVETSPTNLEFLTRVIHNERFNTPRDDAATVSVVSDGRVDFGTTGLAVDFGPGTTPGSVTVSRFNTPPPDTDGLPSGENTSQYRFLITTDGNVVPGAGTTVRFNPSALGGITTPGDVTVYTRSALDAGTFVPLPTTVENGEIVATVTGFSEFVLTSPSDPLPVELTAFDAQQQPDAVLLTWQTASETNNTGFEVQRAAVQTSRRDVSTTAASMAWESVGFVEGAGTTTEAHTYRFRDAQLPFADSLVYRLKQIDVDGTTALSPEVVVRRGPGTEVTLGAPFPNPVRQEATVRYVVPEGAAQSVRLDVYNVLGQRVATLIDETQSPGRRERTINTTRWASGVYFLRLQVGKTMRSQRVTVVR